MQESIQYTVYKAPENRLLTFAGDVQPRWITAMTMVDYNTIAAGDRFGNIFVNRLDQKVSDQVDDDPTGAGILHEKSILMGAPHKTKILTHFHVGDLVTSIHKVSLVAGGREVLLYTGLHGTIGVLVPFVSKEDADFVGTAHADGAPESCWERSPIVEGILCACEGRCDGDASLPAAKQQNIAAELDRSVGEVLKKLEQLRVTASGF
jgi:splicing factor 3B subunit 3